jgi:hypothetical protein
VEKADALPSARWALTWLTNIGVAWRKPIRCYRLLGTLAYFDYRQNPNRQSNFH